MPDSPAALLAWLHTQASVIAANFGDVLTNRAAPARTTLIYTLVTVALVWVVGKIIKKATK